MIVSLESQFGQFDGRDPAVVLAADLILQNFDLWEARDFNSR